MFKQMMQSATDQDEIRQGAWSRSLHATPILAVFLVFVFALFSRLSFCSVTDQAVTALFFNKYQAKMSFHHIFTGTSCRQIPTQEAAQSAHLDLNSSLLDNEE